MSHPGFRVKFTFPVSRVKFGFWSIKSRLDQQPDWILEISKRRNLSFDCLVDTLSFEISNLVAHLKRSRGEIHFNLKETRHCQIGTLYFHALQWDFPFERKMEGAKPVHSRTTLWKFKMAWLLLRTFRTTPQNLYFWCAIQNLLTDLHSNLNSENNYFYS